MGWRYHQLKHISVIIAHEHQLLYSTKKQQKIAIAAGKVLDADGEMLLQHC